MSMLWFVCYFYLYYFVFGPQTRLLCWRVVIYSSDVLAWSGFFTVQVKAEAIEAFPNDAEPRPELKHQILQKRHNINTMRSQMKDRKSGAWTSVPFIISILYSIVSVLTDRQGIMGRVCWWMEVQTQVMDEAQDEVTWSWPRPSLFTGVTWYSTLSSRKTTPIRYIWRAHVGSFYRSLEGELNYYVCISQCRLYLAWGNSVKHTVCSMQQEFYLHTPLIINELNFNLNTTDLNQDNNSVWENLMCYGL